jgi:adenylosuccinate synthase
VEGEVLTEFPADLGLLEASEPVYETLPGWGKSTVGARDFKDLPKEAQAYVDRLSELCLTDIGIISTGPDRLDTLIRSRSPVASWFA